jgi:hypothetical protein
MLVGCIMVSGVAGQLEEIPDNKGDSKLLKCLLILTRVNLLL